MKIDRLPTSVLLCALIAVGATTSEADVISPSADTYVVGNDPTGNFSTEDRYIVRSLGDPVREYAAYIRFDLTSYIGIEDASFSLTAQDDSQAWTATQIEVYGLPDVTGLTPQNWDETTLTYNDTGSEWAKPVVADVNPLDTSNLSFLGNTPGGSPGDTIALTGSALDSFLNSRAGASATLLVVNRYDASRILQLNSTRAASGLPELAFTAIPEPSTLGLIVLSGIGILRYRRRFMS